MKKIAIIILPIFLTLIACESDRPQSEDSVPTFSVEFVCETLSQDETMPRSALYSIIQESKTKIANLSVCETIPTDRYNDYQIPTEALTAAGGWWAGSGDYFYAIQEGKAVWIMQAVVDEMQEGPAYQYKKVVSFSNGKYHFQTGNTLTELAGLYTLGGHDQSWIFFLGIKGETLDAHFFEIDGMLPPDEELVDFLPSYEAQILENFQINTEDLSFNSELGEGKFGQDETGLNITFFDKESHISDQLVLQKIN